MYKNAPLDQLDTENCVFTVNNERLDVDEDLNYINHICSSLDVWQEWTICTHPVTSNRSIVAFHFLLIYTEVERYVTYIHK